MSHCLCGQCDECKERVKRIVEVMREAEEFGKKYNCSPLVYFKHVRKARIDGE